jgi:hypothetical protein
MPQIRLETGAMRRTKYAPLLLGIAAAAVALCIGQTAARAGDDDVANPPSFSEKFWSTLGLKDPTANEYDINYSERSPLVVPPTRDLPPPGTLRSAPVAGWPKDPDIAKRQAAKDDDKPKIRPYDSVIERSRPLRPDELNRTPAPGVGEQSSPGQLGEHKKNFLSFDWTKKEEYATFTGEPTRANLTDPPPGYQTPSADQPYGIGPAKNTYKPPTLGERMEPQR